MPLAKRKEIGPQAQELKREAHQKTNPSELEMIRGSNDIRT